MDLVMLLILSNSIHLISENQWLYLPNIFLSNIIKLYFLFLCEIPVSNLVHRW